MPRTGRPKTTLIPKCLDCGVLLDNTNWPKAYQKSSQYVCKNCAYLRKKKYYHKQNMLGIETSYTRHYYKHREQILAWAKAYGQRPEVKVHKREYTSSYQARLKRQIIEHYAGNPPSCQCCGESIYEFLTIDHINGQGRQKRKELGINSSIGYYSWIIHNNYPDDLQVLCWNCNCGRNTRPDKICPHKVSQN